MGSIIAIDFGTTNTIVAEWLESKVPQAIAIQGLSHKLPEGPPSIPSLVFVDDASTNACRFGYTVLSHGLQHPNAGERLFRSMKRTLLTQEFNQVYHEGDFTIDSRKAAALFLDAVCQGVLASGRTIDELVLTVPVMSFEIYLRWLSTAVQGLRLPSSVIPRIIDEPTAAAFGYGLDTPGGIVLVIDFGGGTLDLSLVRLPYDFEAVSRGIVIGSGLRPDVVLAANRNQVKARVLAKTYKRVGGNDIDEAFVDYILENANLTRDSVIENIALLTKTVEDTKIDLSTEGTCDISVYLRTQKRMLTTSINVEEFNRHVLNSPALRVLDTLREAIAEILAQAERQGVGTAQIDHVLLVGGSTLIPAIKELVFERFGERKVYQQRPFEAVAYGSLVLATSHPFDDILHHAYALEIKRETGDAGTEFDYLPLVRSGTEYPLPQAAFLENYLKPMSDHQNSIDFVIAEIEEYSHPGPRVVLGADGVELKERRKSDVPRSQTIRLLRNKCIIPLDPLGMRSQEDRLDVSFWIDENRRLLLTVRDRLTGRLLKNNEPVTRLE